MVVFLDGFYVFEMAQFRQCHVFVLLPYIVVSWGIQKFIFIFDNDVESRYSAMSFAVIVVFINDFWEEKVTREMWGHSKSRFSQIWTCSWTEPEFSLILLLGYMRQCLSTNCQLRVWPEPDLNINLTPGWIQNITRTWIFNLELNWNLIWIWAQPELELYQNLSSTRTWAQPELDLNQNLTSIRTWPQSELTSTWNFNFRFTYLNPKFLSRSGLVRQSRKSYTKPPNI